MTRIVTLPLSRDPELVFGLRVQDLLWIVAGLAGDLVVWHLGMSLRWRLATICGMSSAAAGVAWGRVADRTLPEWAWLMARFYLSGRLLLP